MYQRLKIIYSSGKSNTYKRSSPVTTLYVHLNISRLPQQNGELSHLKKDILFGLMNNVCTKILTYNTIPSWATVLIHFIFKILRENLLLFEFLNWWFETLINKLQHLIDILLIHITGFDKGLKVLLGWHSFMVRVIFKWTKVIIIIWDFV
jgi:hypothetical protein